MVGPLFSGVAFFGPAFSAFLTVVDVQKSCSDESSARRSTVDQSSTTNITSQPQNDRQARRTVADDTTTTTTTLASTTTTTATTTTGAAGGDEFDVYTIETALPHVEWERIEQSLRASAAAAAGEQNKRWVRPEISLISSVVIPIMIVTSVLSIAVWRKSTDGGKLLFFFFFLPLFRDIL